MEHAKNKKIEDVAVKRYIQRMVTLCPQLRDELTYGNLDGIRKRRVKAICDAVDYAYSRADADTQQLVRLRYWRGEVNLTGAGLRLHLTQDQVYRRINRFLYEVAEMLGEV